MYLALQNVKQELTLSVASLGRGRSALEIVVPERVDQCCLLLVGSSTFSCRQQRVEMALHESLCFTPYTLQMSPEVRLQQATIVPLASVLWVGEVRRRKENQLQDNFHSSLTKSLHLSGSTQRHWRSYTVAC